MALSSRSNNLKMQIENQNILRSSHLQLLAFCVLVFILSRYFFFLEYSFITNTLVHEGKTLVENLWRWDSEHYAGIALHGYESEFHLGGNYAWFPLWPLVLKLFSFNGYFPIAVVSIVCNQALLLASLVIFYSYLQELGFSRDNIRYCIILLAFSPANIYFNSGLSESLFLFLSLSCFYLLEKDKFWLCALIAGLLGATRIVGIMFLIPFIYHQYQKSKFKITFLFVIQVFIIALPLLCYMLYLQVHVGDFLAFIHTQGTPESSRPGFDFTGDIVLQLDGMYRRATAYDLSAFLISLFGTTYVLWHYQFRKQALFNLACIIPIFISGGLWNSFRMCFALFVAYLAATALAQNSILIKMLVLIVAIVMTMVCFIYWLSGSWYFA